MRRSVLRLSLVIAVLFGVSVQTQVAPPQGQSAAASLFVGRWQIDIRPPAGQTGGLQVIPFCIVEISGGPALSAKIIAAMAGAPADAVTVASIAVKDDQLTLALSFMGRQTITFIGKRAGDHLEGTAAADTDPTPASWTGTATTTDKMPSAGETVAAAQAAQPADQKAYTAAVGKPSAADRAAAFKQFLTDFPDSTLKEQATMQLAQSLPTPAEKAAALNAFLKDFPTSRLREQAEYQLTATRTNAAERQQAEDAFLTDHPKSPYASTIYGRRFDTLVNQKPADTAKLTSVIDGMIAASPASGAGRAATMNTIADRLMAKDLLLDRALDAIQQGLAAAGDKTPPASLAIYTTTLGQVLFKLKRYDEAGDALKKALTLAGGDGDGELHLFLGKYYEVKNDETAALDAYLKAYQMGSPYDTKALLDRLYTKKYGSTASLEAKLDEIYRAKPKAFDPGHFARTPPPAAGTPARTVLAELFTGAECAPCVAADLAFDGFSERYEPGAVAVLVYHLHIPGPDPMTNADTEARGKYYGVNGTPTTVIDGAALSSGGGSASAAGARFKEYTGKIESRFDTKPLAVLSGFSSKVNGRKIAITGEASLTADAADRAGHATLHVALVEDSVRYVGSNGIRFHNFVVRKLVGSSQGVVLEAGKKVSVSETVDTAALARSLDGYLTSFEEKQSKSVRGPFTFKDRVTGVQAGTLLVIAFVQDDRTKEILQAAIVVK